MYIGRYALGRCVCMSGDRHVCMCMYVCRYIGLSVCLSVYLSVSVVAYL